MSQLEYRFETLSWAVNSILWMLLAVVSVNLIFGQITSIAGWTKDEVLLLTLVTALFAGCMWNFILPSLLFFSDMIYKGDFDFFIAKPLNIRFLSSVSRMESDNVPRVVLAVILIAVTASRLPVIPSVFSMILFGFYFLMGVLIFYNLFFIFATSAIFFSNLFNLEDLYSNIMDLGKYPVYIFSGSWKILFLYIVPAAYVATFPVQALLGRATLQMALEGFLLLVLGFVVSQWFWNFALKHYSSASS